MLQQTCAGKQKGGFWPIFPTTSTYPQIAKACATTCFRFGLVAGQKRGYEIVAARNKGCTTGSRHAAEVPWRSSQPATHFAENQKGPILLRSPAATGTHKHHGMCPP